MKRGIYLIGLLVILSVGFVAAQSCADNDRILRLSDIQNAHGSLWNGTNYSIEICYSSIFGETYGGSNPHVCSGSNEIVKLFSTSNSHGEIPELNNYTIPVCYGDLVCRSIDEGAGGSCDAFEQIVVRLSDISNSHFSDSSGSYPYAICCKKPSSGNLTVSWRNMLDQLINQSDSTDLVTLRLEGTNLLGKSIDYEIWKSVAFWFDSKVATDSSVDSVTWESGLKDDGTFESGSYYFRAKAEDTDWFSTLDNPDPSFQFLDVTDPAINSLPTVQIILPLLDSKHPVEGISTEPIVFDHLSSDVDDDLNLAWDFDDGTTEEFQNIITEGGGNTTHTYSTSGTKVITAIVEETNRGQKAIDLTRILTYQDGLNIFSIINDEIGQPLLGSTVINAGGFIADGSDSHVAICDPISCPTEGSGVCYPIIDSLSNEVLQCKLLAMSGDAGFDFEWRIDGVIDSSQTGPIYQTFFLKSAQHTIDLKVSYTF